mmetsp:Transcript_19366/g.34299  ORF Transcript_19366/g.34299 Transcript_19366/m.34299 type:complete len:141 (+) Transcript_19366:17-439(+)
MPNRLTWIVKELAEVLTQLWVPGNRETLCQGTKPTPVGCGTQEAHPTTRQAGGLHHPPSGVLLALAWGLSHHTSCNSRRPGAGSEHRWAKGKRVVGVAIERTQAGSAKGLPPGRIRPSCSMSPRGVQRGVGHYRSKAINT